MLYYSIIVSLVIIPLISSGDTTTKKVITSTIKPSFNNKIAKENGTPNTTLISRHSKVTLASEGGLIPDTLESTIFSENHIPLNLDTKSGSNRVKPRKGVVFNNTGDLNSVQSNMTIDTNNMLNTTTITSDLHKNGSSKNDNLTDVRFKTKIKNETKQLKPSVLSYDSLVNVWSVSDNNMPDTKTSPMSFSHNQMSPPSANEEEPTIRIHYMNMSVHKYMIMPIVITMLAIPMFAALGYLALKRGKEAWKNRHYKRMDFLLDGMYND